MRSPFCRSTRRTVYNFNLNLNLIRQWVQVIQLTITGNKAKPYIYPLLSLRWRSNFCLKPANEHPEIISSPMVKICRIIRIIESVGLRKCPYCRYLIAKVSRAHERYRRQTDRQTDGRQQIANVNVTSRSLKMWY